MSIAELSLDVAVLSIVIASSTNTLVKAMLAISIGGLGLGIRVFVPLLVAAGAGLAAVWLM